MTNLRMTTDASVRRLGPDDAPAVLSLRREALETEPLAFASSIEDDRGLSLEFLRGSLAAVHQQAIFGYFLGSQLMGMVGLVRAEKVKMRHKAQIWGMYVSPAARRAGAGRALLQATIQQARTWPGVVQAQLSVTETGTVARTMYEAAGFRVWGREPGALAWESRVVDEFHLVLELDQASQP